jgi:hypothetical protein
MNLKKWYNETIREIVLKILGELAAEFKKENIPDWREAVEVFSDFVNDKLPAKTQDIVNKVIGKLKLTDEVDKIKAFWQKLPAQVRRILTTPLEKGTEKVTWALLGQEGKGVNYGDLAGPLKSVINFNASAELSLGLQALDGTGPDIRKLNLDCAADERFLQLGLAGKLQVGAGVSPALGFLGVKGSGSAQGAAALDYYYKDKSKWLFVEALIDNLPQLASPFDALDISGEFQHRLSAIHLNVDGNLGASLNISGGKTWGASFNVKSDRLDLDTEVSIGAGVNVGYSADLNLAGSWDLLVKPGQGNLLNVRLQRDKSKKKNSTFSLAASVGISGLDVVGEAVIKEYLPDAAPLLEKLNAYLNFGSLLKTELQDQLGDWLKLDQQQGFKADLENALVQTVTGNARADSVTTVIANQAQTVLNSKLELIETKAANAGQKIIKDVVSGLKLPGKLGDKLVSQLTGKVDSFLGKLQGDIQTRLTAIIGENKDTLTTLFKPLQAVGTEVTKLEGDVNKLSQELLQPVINFLTRYQDIRNKIASAVQKSSQLKIALNISRSYKASRAMTTVLEFQVDPSVDKAREYYKEMVAGNFNNALMADRRGKAGIKLTGGSFKAMATDNLTTDVSLNLFGAQFTAKTILKSDVAVQVDAAGNVMMASSSAEMEKVFSGLGETRMVRFLNLMEIPGSLPGGTGDTGKTKLFSSGFSMSFQDKSLKESELKAYLGSLEGADLITPRSLTAAAARYNELAAQAKEQGKSMGAAIALNMSLTSDDIATLIDTADDDISGKAIDYQLNTIFNKRPDAYLRFSKVLFLWNTRNKNVHQQIRDIGALGKLGPVLNRYNIAKPGDITDQEKVLAEERVRLNTALEIGMNALNLVKIIRNMETAGKTRFTAANLKTQVGILNGLNKENNRYLKDWLKVRTFFASLGLKKETIPPVTLAFIATIGDLCQMGYQGTDFLTPSITWTVGAGQAELFT